MRVGLFTDTYLPDINGVVSSTVTLKNALEKQGHTVFIITNHAGSKIELEDHVLRLPGIPLKGLYGYKMSSPISIGAKSYIRNMNLDVIHLQTNFGIGIYGHSLAKTLGIPIVDTYHTMYEDYTHYINPYGFTGVEKVSREAIRAASRQVCNHVQAVIAPSIKTKEILIEYGVIAPIYVCPTGLDLSAFTQAAMNEKSKEKIRKTISADPQAHILLFLGRLAKEKSLEMPIEAMEISTDPNLRLAIVGAGPDENYYRDLVAQKHLEDKVLFLGKVEPYEVAMYYAAADAFVSASLSETQGMTYLEAMAAGKMVFGRRDEVLKDLLDEGETGYYFDSAKELIEKAAIFFALDDEERKKKEEQAKQKISIYTDTMFAHKVAAVYDQAILDYSQTFVVDKIKMEDDYVQLTLYRDSEKEPVRLLIPLEDYFELKISPHVKLDKYLVDSYLDRQSVYKAFLKAKKRVLSKDVTQAQLTNYLRINTEADEKDIREIVEELVSRHLVNDAAYARDKAIYWQDMGYSIRQIRQKLFKAGVDQELIEEAVKLLDDDLEKTNALKLARRLVTSVKAQSSRMKRQTIVNKLLSRGYSLEAARNAGEQLTLDEDDQQALEQCYEKACRIVKGGDSAARRYKIRMYCLRRGFNASAVDALLEKEHTSED